MSTPPPTFDGIGAEPDEASLDAVLDALAHERRRETVSYLAEAGGSLPADELLATVATGGRETETLADGSGRHAIRFHHVHLPKLEDVGLVEYERDTDLVELTALGETVDSRFEDLTN